jgi:integrase/recombinase XerD
MKHLPIVSAQFNHLLKEFSNWLDILGYSETTVNSLPLHVQELLHYLEQNNITQISQVKERHISQFSHHIKSRTNLKHGGALSSSSINKSLQAITTFARYLSQTGHYIIDASPRRAISQVAERAILSQEEIKQLYEASFHPRRENSQAMGQRDRAILAIFYGCGLRKSEGVNLNISDIDLNKKLVFISKAKGNKQRYVPIANRHTDDIRAYIEEGRYWFLENHIQSGVYKHTSKQTTKKKHTDNEAFFLNQRGKRMQRFEGNFTYLREKANITNPFSTHNLRHSIATHLLQSGMPIEEIAKFLGHSSLESTQIYTHIVNQLNHSTPSF